MNSLVLRVGILAGVVCAVSCGFFGADSQKQLAEDEGRTEIMRVSELSGISFSEAAIVTTFEGPGGRNQDSNYCSWGIFSPNEIEMPKKKGSKGEYYLNLPLGGGTEESVQVRMKGIPIRGARAALASDWTSNGYSFTGTLIRADSGDHLSLIRTSIEQ